MILLLNTIRGCQRIVFGEPPEPTQWKTDDEQNVSKFDPASLKGSGELKSV